jgi:hypothetical protein
MQVSCRLLRGSSPSYNLITYKNSFGSDVKSRYIGVSTRIASCAIVINVTNEINKFTEKKPSLEKDHQRAILGYLKMASDQYYEGLRCIHYAYVFVQVLLIQTTGTNQQDFCKTLNQRDRA